MSDNNQQQSKHGLAKARQRIAQCIAEQSIDLSIEGCDISDLNDLPELFECIQLEWLDLNDNNISDLTPLAGLTGLTELYLSHNNISDVTPLAGLTGLTRLHLNDNNISDLTPLAGLTGLTRLHLMDNNISEVGSLSKLTQLQALDLEHNHISVVPKALANIGLDYDLADSSIEDAIRLGRNPITTPPPEILEQGRQAVIDWYDAQRVELNEIKVILIGDAKAGKTSLLKRLKNNSFDENEVQTDGVNIEDLTFADCNTFSQQQDLHGLTGHFWDFGGQEIMNATHQFFLTRRSVYILLLDARKDGNVAGQIRDWLKRVTATGGDSSVIVVANQTDVNPGFGFAGEFELQKEFPQIKRFIKASCKTKQGLDEIKNALNEWLPKAELLHTEIDQRWMKVKDKLQKITKEKHFLNERGFIEICEQCGLSDKRQQANAITFLHDLGLVLHFEEVRLAEYYVLDPYWITYGVYQILTSKRAGEQLGHLSVNDLEFIINKEKDKTQVYRPSNYQPIEYSSAERLFLLDILCNFKLCFRIEKSQPTEFILPDLLSTKEPLAQTQAIRGGEDKISLIYQYAYLPKSILVNVMVDLHQKISERWRTGFVIANGHAKALVSVYDQKLSIHIIANEQQQGQQKRELMAVLRNVIDSANSVLTHKPDLLIPLPGCDDFVEYDELIAREQDGEREYKVYRPKRVYVIEQLLAGLRAENPLAVMSEQMNMMLIKMDKLQHQQSEDLALVFEAIMARLASQSIAFDAKQQQAFEQLQQTPLTQLKLKAAIPLLFGVSLEGEVDVKKWASEQYQKHGTAIFKKLAEMGDEGKAMVK